MIFICKCGTQIAAPEDLVLDAGRETRMLTELTFRIGNHIEQSHKGEIPIAHALGLELTSFLVIDGIAQLCPPGLQAQLDATRARLLTVLERKP